MALDDSSQPATITNIGSLSHNGFDNDIARITTNVLHHFSHPQPFKMP